MASITRRGDRWQARVRRRGYGEQSAQFRTRAAAERWARSIEQQADHGRTATPADARRMTLGAALDRYLREVVPAKRGKAQEEYRIAMWRAEPLAQRALAEVRASDLAAFRDRRLAAGRSANTVRLELAVLSHLYTVARTEWDMAGLRSPLEDLSLPSTRGTARQRRLQPGELWALWKAARQGPAWLAPVIVLAIRTAMRRGELAGLRDGMIQGAVARLPMTKNGRPRAVPLAPGAQMALRRVRRAVGALSAMPEASTLSHAFGAAAKAAGLEDLHFHDLRHEATSRLFEAGLALPEVAAITGHLTWSMLARYTHPRAEALAEKLAAPKKRPGAGPGQRQGSDSRSPTMDAPSVAAPHGTPAV